MEKPRLNQSKTAAEEAQAPIFLHPEQIYAPQGTGSSARSINDIIRLAESIKKYGILEPLVVKTAPSAAEKQIYELISGRKRLQAAISVGISCIPCIVRSNCAQKGFAEDVLDRIRQKELNMFERASALKLLTDHYKLTQEEIAQSTGLSQSAIANKMRLSRLSQEEQRLILSQKLTERHARALLRLKSPRSRIEALKHIITEAMTVSAAEEFIEKMRQKEQEIPENPPFSVTLAPETPPRGITPRKFALTNLTPLYNSIDRILSIFRKTGADRKSVV